MAERTVRYFDRSGVENTPEVVESVVRRAAEGDVRFVVVASLLGGTAIEVAERLRAEGVTTRVVCVSVPSLLPDPERATLKDLGVLIVDSVQEPFGPLMFRDWWMRATVEVVRPESDLFWMALLCVGGHGFRTAVEVVFMAVAAGVVPVGERVIGVGGTGTGADAAIVMRASRFEDAVGPNPGERLRVEEILAMPKETLWTGYG